MRLARRGATLLELVVVLAVLGVIAGVVAVVPVRQAPARESEVRSAMRETLRAAIRSGRPTTVVFDHGGRRVLVTALPDGRLIGDSTLIIDDLFDAANGAR